MHGPDLKSGNSAMIRLTKIISRLLRSALAGKRKLGEKYRERTYSMGVPRVDLTKATALAFAQYDDEVFRKIELR
jgi:hypothetical protein